MRVTRGARRLVPAGCFLLALAVVAPGSAQTFSTFVTADDGVLLATDVYLPITLHAVPSVLIRTTYDKDDLGSLCLVFNLMGQACVAQDTRGRYASSGVDTVFRDDRADGQRTVQWIAEQSWSDGAVAAVGASALAITQYAMAPGAPEALRCLMPIVATPDLYHHAFVQGGALREALATNWLAGQDASEFLEEVKAHRLWDSWWREADALADLGSVQVPALHVGGWYDIFQQGTLDAFMKYGREGGEGARGRQYLVMGPWTHTSAPGVEAGELVYPPNASFDIIELIRDWLGACLEGDAGAIRDWSPVRIYLMGAVGEAGAPGNHWLELADWPPPHRPTPWYLSAGGELHRTLPAADELVLTIDPEDPVPTLGGNNLFPDLQVDGRPMGNGPHDQRPIEGRDDVLVFSSEELERSLTVMGRLSCRLWVRPESPDMDLAVRLSDVYPDGRSMLVADGIQRARMRCGDETECFLDPGQPTEIEVDLWSTALVFNRGHRIRISVSGSNAPRFEVNPNDGTDLDTGTPMAVTPSLLFGPQYPSALVLPLYSDAHRAAGRH